MKSLSFCTLFAIAVTFTSCPKPKPLSGGAIHGHVVALVRVADKSGFPGSTMELPGASVKARNTVTNKTSAAVSTNAHGYFQLPRLDAGTYQVCADAPGFTPSCLSSNVTVTNFTVVLGDPVRILPKVGYVFGQVLLADAKRTPCFEDRPAFHTFVEASVRLVDAGNNTIAGPVVGNGIGEYILPNIQKPGSYRVEAECQAGKAGATVNLTSAETFQNLIIPNSPPQFFRIDATLANQFVRIAPTGSTISLHSVAQDPDGNPLKFKWVDAYGTALGAGSDTISYTLPNNPSSTDILVQANDGMGGFAYSLIPVTGAPPDAAIIAGTVVDADTGVPVGGASVTVNGKGVSTSPNGMFSARVPQEPRYAITVSKLGYALLSKATYSPAAELRLPLQPVIGVPFNAGEGGKIVPRQTDKRSLPAMIVVLPNSLVDGKGNPATGPAMAYIWGYPPGTPIPGDMGGVFEGRTSRLETFGAVDVQLTDAGGQKLQVRPGAKIELILEASNAAPPSTIPLFIFDEPKGIWLEHGKLTLSGNQYRGFLTHLTPFNADLAFGTTGCMEYHVDIENSPSLPFYLHIEQNGQSANHEPFQVNDFAGTVQRLRPGVTTDWWALPTPTSQKADAIGNGSFTSTSYNPSSFNPPLSFGDLPPVGATDPNTNAPLCAKVTLNANFPGHETFLTGLPGPTSPTDEANYSAAVDAWASAYNTFTDFKNGNGFPANDEASAVYFNNGDLKLGRDMHCRVASGGRVACYVSNYNDKAQPPAGAGPALVAAGAAHTSGSTNLLFATVAMIWDPAKTVDTSVQFWVYNAGGNRVTEALLDSEGAKPVPSICVACHGGYYDAAGDHLAHQARFLPFDIASFKTADDVFDPPTVSAFGLDAFTRPNQLGAFRGLNALVRQTDAGRGLSHNAVLELIDGWYGNCGGVTNNSCNACLGGATCPDSFVSAFRPTPWNANGQTQALYDNVVHPYCRGCHVMQPGFDWTDPAQMTGTFKTSIQGDVCVNNPRRMPHGEVPFKGFWQSPTAPLQLTQAPMSLPACQRQ